MSNLAQNPSTGLTPFQFQSHTLRVEVDNDGEPVFHAGDLCALLGHTNPSQAITQHVDACDLTKREVTYPEAVGKQRKSQIENWVREPGMWSFILNSHAPNAKPVKRWVTAEVLPSIRKTGRYELTGRASSLNSPFAQVDPEALHALNSTSPALGRAYLASLGITHALVAELAPRGPRVSRARGTPAGLPYHIAGPLSEREHLAAILPLWLEKFRDPHNPNQTPRLSMGQACKRLDATADAGLVRALEALLVGGINVNRLGKLFSKWQGQDVGGFRIQSAGTARHAMCWVVMKTEEEVGHG
jgi:prophage antirepressor-like protein